MLARVDRAHERLSGPATQHILKREFEVYGKVEFERLAAISNGHLYNLRATSHRRSPTMRQSTPDQKSSFDHPRRIRHWRWYPERDRNGLPFVTNPGRPAAAGIRRTGPLSRRPFSCPELPLDLIVGLDRRNLVFHISQRNLVVFRVVGIDTVSSQNHCQIALICIDGGRADAGVRIDAR